MKKKTVKDVQGIANELLQVRLQKAELTTKDKLLSKALKEHPDFKKQNYFHLVPAVSVVIVDNEKAVAWAKKYAPALITVDTKGAKQIFARDMKIGDGFESKITDRLVAKNGDDEKGYDIG